ncbi:MAG: VOC family protein [Jatrophihabitans sp.]
MRVTRIVPNLHAVDVAAANRWYASVFGLQVRMDLGWVGNVGPADHENVQLQLMNVDASSDVDPLISIGVDDVDEAYRRVVESGAPIVYGPSDEAWGVRRFFLRDPDGNVVNVVSHR